MSTLLPAVLGALVALAGVVGTVVVARWAKSGRIATSEAGQLWDESKSIREQQRQDLAARDARILELETRYRQDLAERDARILELMRQVSERDARLAAVETRLAALESRPQEGA